MSANIDIVTNNGGSFTGLGQVAQSLMGNGFNANSLRTNDVLRKDEWILFDETVVAVARQRLVGVADLLTRGLRLPVANPLGVTRVEWEKVSDMDAAEINMSGITKGDKDRVDFTLEGTPLPIIHKDFSINIRALEASRTLGQTLDTTQAALAARLVSERTEQMLFDGVSAIEMQGANIKGYKTAPNRNTGSISDWSLLATTGEVIIDEVLTMILALQNDNFDGPYIMYVPIDYMNKLLDDFKANSDKSTLSRLLEIPSISDIKVSRNLPGGAVGQVLMVQMTSDVVDMIDGMQPTVLQWETNGGMTVNFKVMSIMAPRMKSDANSQSGIAHFVV